MIIEILLVCLGLSFLSCVLIFVSLAAASDADEKMRGDNE